MRRTTIVFAVAAVAGIALVWMLMRNTREHFNDPSEGGTPTGSTPTGGTPADPPAATETLLTIPENATLRYYITSFSEKTNYTVTPVGGGAAVPDTVYSQNGWNDFITKDKPMHIYKVDPTAVIPTSVRPTDKSDIGMSIANLKLLGPSSAYFGTPVNGTSQVELSSFTMAFYGVWETLYYSTNPTTKVFISLRAEIVNNANNVEISVSKLDNERVTLVIRLGSSSNSFIVDRNVFLSNGNATLYSLVYKKGDSTVSDQVTFNIGNTKFEKVINGTMQTLLGLSEIAINPNGNVDFKLIAFAFYTSALDSTKLTALKNYYDLKMSGIDIVVDTLQAEADELAKRLADANDLLDAAKNDLKSCEDNENAKPDQTPVKHWQISFEGADSVTDDDLKQCTPLKIKAGGSGATGGAATGGAANRLNIVDP